MDDLIQRLTAIFERMFPGSLPELRQTRPSPKVGGYLIWDGFEGIEQLDRQRQVSAALRGNLQPHEVLQVTTILTATPEEAELMQAE